MKKPNPQLLLLIITVCAVLIAMLLFNYNIKNNQLFEENKELKSLLSQSIESVDLSNRLIYNETEGLLNMYPFELDNHQIAVDRNRIKLLYNLNITEASLNLDSNIKLLKMKLNLNDSLIKFSRNFSYCGGRPSSIMVEFLMHEPLYFYGDTVILSCNIFNSPYLLKNTNQLLGFSPIEFGTKIDNTVCFKIPTTRLMKSYENHKDIDFKYEVYTKNIYTNELDTMFSNRTFKIRR